MTVPHLMSKAFSYQDLRRGVLCASQGHDQTKIPRADRVKTWNI